MDRLHYRKCREIKLDDYQIPFYIPWITDDDKSAVMEALNSRWLTGGPKTDQFEKLFAEYIDVKHAISVNSCTTALFLTMKAANIGPGDEVIIPAFTYVATANSVVHTGAKPVLTDIEEKTNNIAPDGILDKINTNTKAIIPVHYAGQACNMREITEIAEDKNLLIIEDCAHSLGSTYEGKQTGSFGLAGCFSLYPTKIITALEGGMITTNDDKIEQKLRLLRSQGITKSAIDREQSQTWEYDVTECGYSSRLNEIQSALGISQIKKISEGIKIRNCIAKIYNDKITKSGIEKPYVASNRNHTYHLYVIKIIKEKFGLTRDKLYNKLAQRGVQTSVHFIPIHYLSYYKNMCGSKTSYPITEKIFKQVLSLPLYPTLEDEKINYIINLINDG